MSVTLDRPSFQTARAMVQAHAQPIGCESVGLIDAAGRVLAVDAVARRDSPPCDMAAMDGFAIPTALFGSAEPMPLGPPIHAGSSPIDNAPAQARPIGTGALVPVGTQAIVPKEQAKIVRDQGVDCVRVVQWPRHGASIRRRGEDARQDDSLLLPGAVITPGAVGALASFGVADLMLARQPRIAILTTGDELVPVGEPALAYQQINSNGPMVAAMAARAGLPIVAQRHVPDEPDRLARELEQLMQGAADIVVTTAGVSVGAKDLVRSTVESLGGTVLFHGVRMRPGKPVLFSRFPNGTLHFGLPGNPVAAAVAMRFFVLGAARAMLGQGLERGAAVDVQAQRRDGTTSILKAVATSGWGEALNISIAADQRSHTMRPLLNPVTWVVVPPFGDPDPVQAFASDMRMAFNS